MLSLNLKESFTFGILVLAAIIAPLSAKAQIHTSLTWAPTHGHHDYIIPYLGFSYSGHYCTVAVREQIDSPLFAEIKPVFLRSNDNGRTWEIQDPGFPNPSSDEFRFVCQIDSLNVIASGGDSMSLYRTTNGGKTWNSMNTPTNYEISSLHFSDSLTGICTDNLNEVFTTMDGGLHWDTTQLKTGTWPEDCHSYGNGKFRVYAYAYGPVYTTYDNWKTYDSSAEVVAHGPDLPNKVLGDCNFSGGDTLLAYGDDLDSTIPYALIMRSTDAGMHWTQVADLDNAFESVTCMSNASRDTIVAGGLEALNKILISFDHGATWKIDTLICDTNYPEQEYECHGIALTISGNLIAGFGGNLGYSSLVYGSFAESGVKMIEESSITNLQIYPNPALQTVSILSLEAGKHVDVLDVLGRQVLSGKVPASGPFTLDVSGLAAGTYYVSGGHTEVRFIKK